jgi:hypothetical protein
VIVFGFGVQGLPWVAGGVGRTAGWRFHRGTRTFVTQFGYLAVGARTVIGHHAYVERWNHEHTDFGLAD